MSYIIDKCETIIDKRLPKGLAIYLNHWADYCIINDKELVVWFNTPRGQYQACGRTIEETIENYFKIMECFKCKHSIDFILNDKVCAVRTSTGYSTREFTKCSRFKPRENQDGK